MFAFADLSAAPLRRHAATSAAINALSFQRHRYRISRRAKIVASEASKSTDGGSSIALPDDLENDEVVVRFINVPGEREVVATASAGENLLNVSDNAGVHIPRGCKSGLCGTCTTDIVDTDSETGVQVVRACQTGVAALSGQVEMIVDVHRTQASKRRSTVDPMARFENLDTDYVPGAAPRRFGAKRLQDCSDCSATGDVECYGCKRSGNDFEPTSYPCGLCLGTGKLRCATCQGKGMMLR